MKEIRSVDISGKLSPASIHSIEKAGEKWPSFLEMRIWETRIPSQRQILQECLYTISNPWAAMPSNRWQAMSMAQNKDYGRDCLFFRNQRLSHIHDITDFPTRCVRAFCLKRRPFSPPLGHFRWKHGTKSKRMYPRSPVTPVSHPKRSCWEMRIHFFTAPFWVYGEKRRETTIESMRS